jgi:hypothetical protein
MYSVSDMPVTKGKQMNRFAFDMTMAITMVGTNTKGSTGMERRIRG